MNVEQRLDVLITVLLLLSGWLTQAICGSCDLLVAPKEIFMNGLAVYDIKTHTELKKLFYIIKKVDYS